MKKNTKRRHPTAMAAYPTKQEATTLEKGRRITGESESRFLIEGGLLRAKVIQDRLETERARAVELAEKFPNIAQ